MSRKLTLEDLSGEDIIDLRVVTERAADIEDSEDPEEQAELKTLLALLEDLRDYGRDYQWRGDWYPGSLIRDSYFEEYARDLADDIGAIDSNARWPLTCIDWEQAARELQQDYSSVEFEGITYWHGPHVLRQHRNR